MTGVPGTHGAAPAAGAPSSALAQAGTPTSTLRTPVAGATSGAGTPAAAVAAAPAAVMSGVVRTFGSVDRNERIQARRARIEARVYAAKRAQLGASTLSCAQVSCDGRVGMDTCGGHGGGNVVDMCDGTRLDWYKGACAKE